MSLIRAGRGGSSPIQRRTRCLSTVSSHRSLPIGKNKTFFHITSKKNASDLCAFIKYINNTLSSYTGSSDKTNR